MYPWTKPFVKNLFLEIQAWKISLSIWQSIITFFLVQISEGFDHFWRYAKYCLFFKIWNHISLWNVDWKLNPVNRICPENKSLRQIWKRSLVKMIHEKQNSINWTSRRPMLAFSWPSPWWNRRTKVTINKIGNTNCAPFFFAPSLDLLIWEPWIPVWRAYA